MDSEERRFIICTQRKALLSSLNTVYPGRLTGKTLFEVQLGAYPDYSRSCFHRDMRYLLDKGFVARQHPLTGRESLDLEFEKANWSLTALGNEIANRMVVDPALEV